MVYLGSEPQKSINTTPKNIFICPSWKETQCMQKGLCMMHSVWLCLLVTRLDAAAPGGASSNRRWVWTRPQALRPATRAAPGHRHPIGRSRTGPRPRWVKRGRAGRPREGAQDQGWFSPRASRLHSRLQCRGLSS